MDSPTDTPKGVGCPIRTSTDQRPLAAPRGFSQRATSFVASWCQGIHRMHFSCSTHPPRAGTIHAPKTRRATSQPPGRDHSFAQHTHTHTQTPLNTPDARGGAPGPILSDPPGHPVRRDTARDGGRTPGLAPGRTRARSAPAAEATRVVPRVQGRTRTRFTCPKNRGTRTGHPRGRSRRPTPWGRTETGPNSRDPSRTPPTPGRGRATSAHPRPASRRQTPAHTRRRTHAPPLGAPRVETAGLEPATPCLQSR